MSKKIDLSPLECSILKTLYCAGNTNISPSIIYSVHKADDIAPALLDNILDALIIKNMVIKGGQPEYPLFKLNFCAMSAAILNQIVTPSKQFCGHPRPIPLWVSVTKKNF